MTAATALPARTAPVKVAALTTVVVLGGFMAGLDTSLVNVGLTTMAGDLHTAVTDVQWVTSGYLLALAAALPAGPWLQRRLGPSRLWLLALAVFTLASLLCAVAPDLRVLVVSRLLQGVAGGLLVPTGQSIVAGAVGPERMGRTMASAGVVVVLAPAIGPALGGLLVDTLSWRWLFVVNLPIGIVTALLAARVLPHQAPDATARLDRRGLLLLSTALPATTFGITQLAASGQRTVGLLLTAAGLTLLAAFVADATHRRRATRPVLLDLDLFRRPSYTAAQVTVFFLGLSQFGGLLLLPLYFETLRGFSVVHTGLLLLVYGAGAMLALPLGGRLTDRCGGGVTCVTGLVVTIVATLPFVVLPADANLVTVEVLQALRGVGVGLSGIPAVTAAMRAAPGRIADATTTATIVQRVGGSLGTAFVAVVVTRITPGLAAVRTAHGILALTAVLALVAALALRAAERRSPAATPAS